MRDNTNPLLTDRPNEYGDDLVGRLGSPAATDVADKCYWMWYAEALQLGWSDDNARRYDCRLAFRAGFQLGVNAEKEVTAQIAAEFESISEETDTNLAEQQQELADLRRIRALLIRSLLRAIGETDEGVITDPLTAACAHAKRVELLRTERDALAKEKALDGFCAHAEVLCGDCTNDKGFAIWHRPPTCKDAR